ncbi:F-box only protein 7-like [Apium graveolens]|uniref:F-box only protein 7-like n=1 Tax=Apium graveolens TaxID=4045 RepID=UPI003D7A7615
MTITDKEFIVNPSASGFDTAKSRNISRIINHISGMSWADLPADILMIIFGLLDDINIHNLVDLYQCLAVCRSWRSVAKQIWQTHILPTTPWLLFHIDLSSKIFFKTNRPKCHDYPSSLATNDDNSSFSYTLNNMKTCASYDGWLLLGNSDNQPFLYNPITALLLQLPPLPPFPRLQLFMKFVSSGASPTDHNSIICIMLSDKRGGMIYHNTTLAFCRPAVSTSWVRLQEMAEDIIFYGGKFYTIGSGGALFVYNSDIINGNTNFCTGKPWKEIKLAEAVFNTKSLPHGDCCCFYLVESKHRELLMIMRTVEKKNFFTKSFRIFKLNESDKNSNGRRNYYYRNYWKEISSLPEKESIILLWNEGMSISVDDHNGYKSNSIYFYDEMRSGHATTYGIYDLGSRKISHKTGDGNCLYYKLFTPKISNV